MTVSALAEQLKALQTEVAELRAENRDLRADESPTGEAEMTPHGDRPFTRRGLLAAAAGAAVGLAITARPEPAAAANGGSVLLGSVNASTQTTRLDNTSLNGNPWVGLHVTTNGPGTGIRAEVNTGNSVTGGIGVYGRSTSNNGANFGGWGGLFEETATAGTTRGVEATAASTAGTALRANATAASGTTYGVYSRCVSPAGYALYGEGRLKVTGRSYLNTPTSAPADADLANASISFYLNQAGNALKIRVKYGNGTLKTGTINLV
jgi:hypothetical protein